MKVAKKTLQLFVLVEVYYYGILEVAFTVGDVVGAALSWF
jgi:hypothetical protein